MQFTPVTHVLFDMDGLILSNMAITHLPPESLRSRYICIDHFDKKYVRNETGHRKRLRRTAIPNPYQAPEVLDHSSTTVLDTEELYTKGFQNITSRYGKDFTFELKLKLMGTQALECATIVIEELDLPMTVDELLVESMKEFEVLFPNTDVMPGARRLIEHLVKHNIPIALATSSSVENYKLKTVRHQDLFSLFPIKVLGSSDPDVKNGKPSPDIFLVAASRFPDKPNPEQCLVIEDAINGVKAGRAAGMQVVMVPDPRLDEALRKEATLVINSLDEFKPELFGLPPFDD